MLQHRHRASSRPRFRFSSALLTAAGSRPEWRNWSYGTCLLLDTRFASRRNTPAQRRQSRVIGGIQGPVARLSLVSPTDRFPGGTALPSATQRRPLHPHAGCPLQALHIGATPIPGPRRTRTERAHTRAQFSGPGVRKAPPGLKNEHWSFPSVGEFSTKRNPVGATPTKNEEADNRGCTTSGGLAPRTSCRPALVLASARATPADLHEVLRARQPELRTPCWWNTYGSGAISRRERLQ